MESRTAALEDVLYQKGASFSAKLDDTNSIDNNNIIDVPSDPSTSSLSSSSSSASSSSMLFTQRMSNNIEPHVAPSREYFDSLATIARTASVGAPLSFGGSSSSDEMYYSKDMSIFDDVNNNRLNLPLINDRFTVRQAPQLLPQDTDEGPIADYREPQQTTPTSTASATSAASIKRTPRTGGNFNVTWTSGNASDPLPGVPSTAA